MRLQHRALMSALTVALAATVAAVPLVTAPEPASAVPPVPTLKAKAEFRGLRIGTAVRGGPLTGDTRYRSWVTAEFNSVTPEHALQWYRVEPQRGLRTWGEADQILALPGVHRYGQPLVSPDGLPPWLTAGTFTPTELRQILREHVQTTVRRYAGVVEAWTVVDEPLNPDGTRRQSLWQRELGDSYIAEAFAWAREADPAARLYLVDSRAEGVSPKSDALHTLVGDLRAAGVPVDGVGFKSHRGVGQLPTTLRANLERFAALGVEVRITEFDVLIPLPATLAGLNAQAADYATVTAACRAVTGCVGITFWGFTDRYSWINEVPIADAGAPLLLTAEYQRKPAYTAVLNALIGFPDTEAPVRVSLRAGAVTADGVSLVASAEDNNFVYGFEFYREAGDTDVLVRSQVDVGTLTLTGLAPGTYTYYAVARDAAGNRTPSAPVTVTVGTPPTAGPTTPTGSVTPGPACEVRYRVTSSWNGGFLGEVTIRNTGPSVVRDWVLGFDFTGGQVLRSGWHATWIQDRTRVTVTAPAHARNLAPGGTHVAGFVATAAGAGGGPVPSAFTLSGTACTGA